MKRALRTLSLLAPVVLALFFAMGHRRHSFPEEPGKFHYTTEQRARGVAVNALLCRINLSDFFSLAGRPAGSNSVGRVKRDLLGGWGVGSKAELLQTLNKVWRRGHRGSMQEIRRGLARGWSAQAICLYAGLRGHPCSFRRVEWVREHADELDENSLVAWDLARVVSLARWGFGVGYFSREEAWAWIMPATREIQNSFGSWEELGEDYLLGRSFWGGEPEKEYKFRKALYRLLNEPGSPWKTSEWDLDLSESEVSLQKGAEPLPPTAYLFEMIEQEWEGSNPEALDSFQKVLRCDRDIYKGVGCWRAGNIYKHGWGVPLDKETAARIFEKGAELGNLDCLVEVGVSFWRKKSFEKARELFEKSASRGSLYGLKNLGVFYEHGYGVEKDIDQAMACYEKAAKWGLPAAQANQASLMCEYPRFWEGERAVELAREAAKNEPIEFNCSTLVDALVKAERYPEALKAWEGWASFYKQRANNWDDLALPEKVKKVRRDILEKLNG